MAEYPSPGPPQLACSIGTNSHAAAEKVYAAASKILGEKLYCRLTDMTDAEVALEDPHRIADLLAAQNSAARSAGGRSLALCTHTHTHTHTWSSRACASACASRAPGYESVKGHNAALAADATAALQKSGVFSGNITLLREWEGCQKQADCSKGGTIGCVFRAAPTATHPAAVLTARTRTRIPRSAARATRRDVQRARSRGGWRPAVRVRKCP